VLETDEYFYLLVGDDPARYDYDEKLLPAARQWNFERFRSAIAQSVTPIVVDRGNGLNRETQRYARYAVEHGYHVELKEPESPWWQEIRALLRDPQGNQQRLGELVARLAQSSIATHRVPASTIQRWMAAWKLDLTVEQILNFRSRD
jgi:hypothetical protein